MDDNNNAKRDIPEELPDELLASLAAGGEYICVDNLFPRIPPITRGCKIFELKPGEAGLGKYTELSNWPCVYCKYWKGLYHRRN